MAGKLVYMSRLSGIDSFLSYSWQEQMSDEKAAVYIAVRPYNTNLVGARYIRHILCAVHLLEISTLGCGIIPSPLIDIICLEKQIW